MNFISLKDNTNKTINTIVDEYMSLHNLPAAQKEGLVINELSFQFAPYSISDKTLWRTRNKATFELPPQISSVKAATAVLSVHTTAKEQAWMVADAITEYTEGRLFILQSRFVEHMCRGVLSGISVTESVKNRKYKITLTLKGQEVGAAELTSTGQGRGGVTVTVNNPGTAYSPAYLEIRGMGLSAELDGIIRNPVTYKEETLKRIQPDPTYQIFSGICSLDGVTGAVFSGIKFSASLSQTYNTKAEFEAAALARIKEHTVNDLIDAPGLPLIPPGTSEVVLTDISSGPTTALLIKFRPVYM